MTSKLLTAALAALLVPTAASAGGKKIVVGSGESPGYAYSVGEGDEGVRFVVTGEGTGDVIVVTDDDGEGERVLKMRTADGRMVLETEPCKERPWLGVLLTPGEDGIEINSVMEGSPAARAGLKAGDLLVRADGRDLTDSSEQDDLLRGKSPGDSIRFVALRDGKKERLQVELQSHPGRVEFDLGEHGAGLFGAAGNALAGLGSLKKLESLKGLSALPLFVDCDEEEGPCPPTILSFSTRSKPRLGVTLESLSPQLATFFQVEAGTGLLVKEVLEGSVAESAGLKAGDVLVRIDDTPINVVGDVREALSDVSKGEAVRVEIVRRGVRETFTAELDSDPVEDAGAAIRFAPFGELERQGTQGALEWLERAREGLDAQTESQVRAALEAAQLAAERARNVQVEAESRRALESALEEVRRAQGASESERTY